MQRRHFHLQHFLILWNNEDLVNAPQCISWIQWYLHFMYKYEWLFCRYLYFISCIFRVTYQAPKLVIYYQENLAFFDNIQLFSYKTRTSSSGFYRNDRQIGMIHRHLQKSHLYFELTFYLITLLWHTYSTLFYIRYEILL